MTLKELTLHFEESACSTSEDTRKPANSRSCLASFDAANRLKKPYKVLRLDAKVVASTHFFISDSFVIRHHCRSSTAWEYKHS